MKVINKKVIAIATAALVSMGVGIRTYVAHNANNSKASAAYASTEGASKGGSSSEGSSKNSAGSNDKKDTKEANGNSTSTTGPTSPTSPNSPTDPRSPEAPTVSKNPVVNFKDFFKRDVFMGDSITDGISYCDFLNEANVCAKIGININNTKNEVNRIAIQNPRNIYMLYGVNDMDDTMPSQWFVEQYRDLVHRVKARFPNANIYIQSVLPVAPIVEQKTPHINNKHINETNEGLKVMAREENVNYLNIASILNENNRDLYEEDGTHFKSPFYTLWLNYVANNVK